MKVRHYMKKFILIVTALSAIFIGANIMQSLKPKSPEKKNILKAPLYFDISTFLLTTIGFD